MHIRPARADELARLQEIERAAGQVFRTIGMGEIAEDEPLSVPILGAFAAAGLAWVATDERAVAVAYLLAERLPGSFHVEQVSVHPRAARQGVGRRLLEHLADHARAARVPALTLTTFAEVPWNAPYYRRCGFRTLDDAELTAELREIRRHEADHGLDRWPRVCMRRDL